MPEDTPSWLRDVEGDEVPALINTDAALLRAEAGPGTGKTFGLMRRVHRLLHHEGAGLSGGDVLVVAFNRVIARQLADEISAELSRVGILAAPEISTVHALCLRAIGGGPRLLLPHEREAMLYDVLTMFPQLRERVVARGHRPFEGIRQALHDHEAGHQEDMELWQAVTRWLNRHDARLISDLPRRLLEHIKAGDYGDRQFTHVIVDEFQDLTPAEQELFFRLRRPGGSLIALGDSRQSIYAFRGNDREGLRRLDRWAAADGEDVIDLPLRACRRCPPDIVQAANQLMTLSPDEAMIPGSAETADVHLVHWKSPTQEATGMAEKIVANLRAHPDERHLVMATRRQFGYALRDAIQEIAPEMTVDLTFEEGLLESWPAREAFLLFCLLVDPDPSTWRAWLGYQRPRSGSYKAPERNTDAYLQLLTSNDDRIDAEVVEALAKEERAKQRGRGGANLWERANRYVSLVEELGEGDRCSTEDFVAALFSESLWEFGAVGDAETERLDLDQLREKVLGLVAEVRECARVPEDLELQEVARQLRYKVATREPFAVAESADLQVSTLWGAKGVTAHHVYVIGLCDEALPGERRDEYPGTTCEYVEEQRRLFYVSLTRARKTLVLSRARGIKRSYARRLGLRVTGTWHTAALEMCRFLRDLTGTLPEGKAGNDWTAWPLAQDGE